MGFCFVGKRGGGGKDFNSLMKIVRNFFLVSSARRSVSVFAASSNFWIESTVSLVEAFMVRRCSKATHC